MNLIRPVDSVELQSLPGLSERYPLSSEQIEAYRHDGHICSRGVATGAEVAAYRPHIVAAVARHNTQSASLDDREGAEKRHFIQVVNLWERDDAVRKFVFASRFAQIAADLLGVDRVRLFYDQALFKEPGGPPTEWHQDDYAGLPPVDTDKIVSMWMPLVPIGQSMEFVSGAHTHRGFARRFGIDEHSDAYYERLIAENDLRIRHYGAMAAGDATFHAGWTPHRASSQPRQERLREVMVVIYFADGARVLDPAEIGVADNETIQREMKVFGWKPGDAAAGPVAPLVYEREASHA